MPTVLDPPLNALGLAATGAVVERQYPIGGFARLADRLADASGSAQVRLELALFDGTPVGRLELRAPVSLICQRCLGPLRRELVSESRLAFVAGDDAEVPAEYEAVAGDARRIDLAALVEDELLLSLPLIVQHAPEEDCSPQGAVAESRPVAPEMRRPFAGLKDLLKH
ncbi:MAG: YceD family protein [Steroidobacteraceae bacterium]